MRRPSMPCITSEAGPMDCRSSHRHPGKYTLRIAENESAKSWQPLHVEQGYAADQDVVTLFGAGSIINVCDHTSQSPESMLNLLGRSMAHAGQTHPFFGGPAL